MGEADHSYVAPETVHIDDSDRHTLFDGIETVAALRMRIRASVFRSCTQWIAAGGSGATDTQAHGAFLTAIALCGLVETGRPAATIAIADWSKASHVSADGLAIAAVCLSTLAARGTTLIGCRPQDGDLAVVLSRAGLDSLPAIERWVDGGALTRRSGRMRLLVPPVYFNGTDKRSGIATFLSAAEGALDACGLASSQIETCIACTSEFMLNAIGHTYGSTAAATILIEDRRRPPVVQLGFADNGPGIGSTLAMQDRHAWTLEVADRGATSAVFGGYLSGRDAQHGGGGMTRLVRDIVADQNATVTVRSGAARVVISPHAAGPVLTPVGFTYGWGTQVRLDVPTASKS